MNFWRGRRRMHSVAQQSTKTAACWKDLYVAALLEGDKDRVPFLIAQAEQAIVERARELFNAKSDTFQEQEALGEALYALHALKSCLTVHGRFADVT